MLWKRRAGRKIARPAADRNETGRQPAPSLPRHTRPPLPLLPSGPDGIHGLVLRGDRHGPPSNGFRYYQFNAGLNKPDQRRPAGAQYPGGGRRFAGFFKGALMNQNCLPAGCAQRHVIPASSLFRRKPESSERRRDTGQCRGCTGW